MTTLRNPNYYLSVPQGADKCNCFSVILKILFSPDKNILLLSCKGYLK